MRALLRLVFAFVIACGCKGFCPRTQLQHQWSLRDVSGAEAVLREQWMHVCAQAAREGGRVILQQRNKKTTASTKSNDKDLVTETDVAAQRAIKQLILHQYPQHSFLGEEDVKVGQDGFEVLKGLTSRDAAHVWIVDPLDGTINFCHDLGLSAVSIALSVNAQVVCGCIYDPYRDELFSSVRGGGAFLNGQPIRVSPEATLANALVCTGSPPKDEIFQTVLKGLAAIGPRCRSVRFLGSAAIMLAWVACGRLNCYFEPFLNCWDSAAGALIVQEAGGTVTDVYGATYTLDTRYIVASSTGIHMRVLDTLQQAQAY